MSQRGPQRRAVERTLRMLKGEGTLDRIPDALVELCRGVADACDCEPGNAALWREFRAALDDLREAAAGAPDDDTADFLISIQTPRGRTSVEYPEVT